MMGIYRGFMGSHMPHMGWFGLAILAALVALVVVAIVLAVKSGRRYRAEGRTVHAECHASHAEEILKERLAKGEIDANTYDELLKKIK